MKVSKLAAMAMATTALVAVGEPTTVPNTQSLDLARQLNDAFIQVADHVSSCVVVIEVSEKDSNDGPTGPLKRFFQGHPHRWQRHQMDGEGSGVIITEDGYILTNNHVVQDADSIIVRLRDGRSFPAHVRGTDPQSDVAVIKIDAKGLPTAVLGDSDKTRVGEFVLAIGAPFELSYSVTVGHVSAKGRAFADEDTGIVQDQDYIQTDASINPGNSGGPLVNLYGEVIGLNSMIEGMDRGIGFAVPINIAKRVKDHLIAEGKFVRSWIGIRIETLREDPDYQGFIKGVTDGVVVTGIEADSPAAASNLKLGDVIVAVDGKGVATDRQLKDDVSGQPAGKVVNVEVMRDSAHVSVPIKLAAMPGTEAIVSNDQSSEPSNATPESNAFGLTVQAITRQLARQYGLERATGLVVTSVEEGSPADDTGIQEGDVITEVNRHSVTTMRQFREAMKAGDPKSGEWLNLLSKGARRMVVLRDSN